MRCERCTSPMQYTTTRESEEVHKYGICDSDYWLCLFCGNEVIINGENSAMIKAIYATELEYPS